MTREVTTDWIVRCSECGINTDVVAVKSYGEPLDEKPIFYIAAYCSICVGEVKHNFDRVKENEELTLAMIDSEEFEGKLTKAEKEYVENLRIQQNFLVRIQQLTPFIANYDTKVYSVIKEYEKWIQERSK